MLRLRTSTFLSLMALLLTTIAPQCLGQSASQRRPISIAVLPFESKTDPSSTELIARLLTVELSSEPNWLLVEREDLEDILKEMQLNVSGLVKQQDAIRIGQLTGAQLLITGSLFDAGGSRYVVAKIISSETSRVAGVSIKLDSSAEVDSLTKKLSKKIKQELASKAESLVAEPANKQSVVDNLQKLLRKSAGGKRQLPSLAIKIQEQHVGEDVAESAIASELSSVLTELGFTVFDSAHASKADLEIRGQGTSEFGTRRNDLISVRGRVQLEVARKGQVLFADNQAAMTVGLTEVAAGREALESASLILLERLVPELTQHTVPPRKKNK